MAAWLGRAETSPIATLNGHAFSVIRPDVAGQLQLRLYPAGEFRVPAFYIASAVRDAGRRLLVGTMRGGACLFLFGLDMLHHSAEVLVLGDGEITTF